VANQTRTKLIAMRRIRYNEVWSSSQKIPLKSTEGINELITRDQDSQSLILGYI
jgi:hypothetical protein